MSAHLQTSASTLLVHPTQVRVVELALRRDSSGLQLILRLQPVDQSSVVTLYFSGVVDLRFLGPTTELNNLVTLEVEDISTRGWEDLQYRVRDVEEEFLSFYCHAYFTMPDPSER